ncbi:MAG: PD40 domain-containing protein, partial [Candidatus Eisenbacteria bacterium]|nr:PD40 domain-containing protein [Candidatus Eisenbacteria bacterium]
CTPNCDTLYFDRDDDIYMSVRADTGWTQAVALPDPVNTDFEERYPAISADRQRLYFSSDRPPDVPGTGGRDIWVALWGGSSWDSVMNLGFPVNTMNEETRPFESYDGQRLYFSNNHGQPRPGISYGGASDIYVATWADTGWGPVYLVVAPINNDLTACSPYESPDGEEIWFGSEAWEGGRGDEDIWVATTGVSYYPRPTEGYGSWLKAVDIPEAINVYDLEEGWDGTIYAAVACSGVEPTGRVFKTTNKGLSWAPCADLPGAMVVYSLIVDGDTLYAGTYPNGDVFKSVNRGVSWVNTAELPAVTTARSLVRLNNGDILVGTSPYDFSMRNRIFRSTDCGLSWTETASLAQINPCKFIQQTSSGAIFAGGWGIDSQIMIHKSVDNGASWESVVVIDQDECEWTADCFLESETGELFVSGWIPAHGVGFGGGYVCMSTDGGTSWTVCPKIMRGDGVHSGRIYAVTEDPLGTLYAGMQPAPDSVVFASSDKGLTWFSTGGLGGAFECLCLLRTGDGELFAGTTPNGDVFRYAPLIGVAETESPPARQLVQSAPNPFSSSTTIRFTLPEAGRVKVRVFDAQGRCVRTLLDRRMGPGWQYEDFDGTDDNGRRMASGVYIYQVETEKFTASRKFVYLR